MASLIGQTLLGQFRVDRFIAAGGMGSVYSVWDIRRNTQLAMKVLHGDLADDASVFKRFQREARVLQNLAHPHIVPFYGLYETRGIVFMLQRFVEGPTLQDILRTRKKEPLPADEVLIHLKALASALGYAHTSGVVHCDVKPGNVMTDHTGNIFLTDFGISRFSDSTATSFAHAGTPAYMAPEQIRGEKVSAATDIYALGIVLYEMLTGQRPFNGKETASERYGQTLNERMRYAQLKLAPPDPRSINPALTEGMASVVLRALRKNPDERFRSTQELFQAFCVAAGATAKDIPDRLRRAGQTVVPPSSTPVIEKNVVEQVEQKVVEAPTPQVKPLPIPVRSRKMTPFFFGGVLMIFLIWLGLTMRSSGSMGAVFQIETKTPTRTASPVPPTLTLTLTPSPTRIPSATPVITWSEKSVVDAGLSSRPGPYLSAVTDGNGTYYIAFYREQLDRLMVMQGDGDSWRQLNNLTQINGEGRSVGNYVHMSMNEAGLPYLFYQVRTNRQDRGTARVASFTGSRWNISTMGPNIAMYDMRTSFDASGTPHHAILAQSGDVLYAASSSVIETLETDAVPPPSATFGHSYFPLAIAVNSLHQPMLCFSKSEQIQCRHKVGDSWRSVNVPGKGSFPSMQFDEVGNLHLAFYDQQARVLKYGLLAEGSSSWKVNTVDPTNEVGQYPSLQVDKNGLVHISYCDQANSALKYALGQLGGWSTYIVDNDVYAGLISSLVLDAGGSPAIAYYDAENVVKARIMFISRQDE